MWGNEKSIIIRLVSIFALIFHFMAINIDATYAYDNDIMKEKAKYVISKSKEVCFFNSKENGKGNPISKYIPLYLKFGSTDAMYKPSLLSMFAEVYRINILLDEKLSEIEKGILYILYTDIFYTYLSFSTGTDSQYFISLRDSNIESMRKELDYKWPLYSGWSSSIARTSCYFLCRKNNLNELKLTRSQKFHDCIEASHR